MIVNFILDYRPGVAVIIEKGPHKDICGKVSIFFKCTHCYQSHIDKFIPCGILTSERCVFFLQIVAVDIDTSRITVQLHLSKEV